ncbi:hypothetical protein [Methylomicrobium album]|uniref:Uncharacterized protein n=1 Tax=Methylomicrobium album BG8 TaxID=686340 RepID=H8GJG0_METAL|nr:hypothetical protein [Methylomicrobium album]EIC30320.1 hypothetical protein Metal_2606 [Methylomicrobium album BG8]
MNFASALRLSAELGCEDVKMKRTINQWTNCNPAEMVKMSEAAIMYALQDARADIMMLPNAELTGPQQREENYEN